MSGFTLLELITAMTVLAILVSIAIPSFANLTRANQIAAASNELVTALSLARSESVKRGIRVSVCASNGEEGEDAVCTGESTWGNGWIAITDDFGAAGIRDEGDEILQAWQPPAAGVIVSNEDDFAVTFTRRGNAEFASDFAITKEDCGTGQRRNISVGPTGRIAIARADCP